MRTVVFEIPEQYLCTKDAINICIDGLVYYRPSNPDGTVFSRNIMKNISDSSEKTVERIYFLNS